MANMATQASSRFLEFLSHHSMGALPGGPLLYATDAGHKHVQVVHATQEKTACAIVRQAV